MRFGGNRTIATVVLRPEGRSCLVLGSILDVACDFFVLNLTVFIQRLITTTPDFKILSILFAPATRVCSEPTEGPSRNTPA